MKRFATPSWLGDSRLQLRTGICWGLGCWLAASTSLHAQPAPVPPREVRSSLPVSAEDAAAQLLALQGRLRALRAEAIEQEESQHRRLRELAAEERAMRRTVEALRKDRERKESELADQQAELARRQAQAGELEGLQRSLCRRIQDYLERLTTHVEGSIPWRLTHRLAAIGRVRELLGEDGLAPAAALASVARIQRDEEALGRGVESSTLQVDVDGVAIAVKGFHLGLLAVVFASEDGNVVGFCQGGQALSEGLRIAREHPEAASGYLQVVDILERRRTPGLVDLYLPGMNTAKGSPR